MIENDSVGEFLEECCALAQPGNRYVFTGMTVLHKTYMAWCQKKRVSPLWRPQFQQSMAEKGFGDGSSDRHRVDGKTTRGYFGILLKDSD